MGCHDEQDGRTGADRTQVTWPRTVATFRLRHLDLRLSRATRLPRCDASGCPLSSVLTRWARTVRAARPRLRRSVGRRSSGAWQLTCRVGACQRSSTGSVTVAERVAFRLAGPGDLLAGRAFVVRDVRDGLIRRRRPVARHRPIVDFIAARFVHGTAPPLRTSSCRPRRRAVRSGFGVVCRRRLPRWFPTSADDTTPLSRPGFSAGIGGHSHGLRAFIAVHQPVRVVAGSRRPAAPSRARRGPARCAGFATAATRRPDGRTRR